MSNEKLKPKVTILPAAEKTHRNEKQPDGSKKRVGAYVRVSTFGEQASSYDLQIKYFKEFIRENPNWELVKIYSDEGITGTSIKNREGFKQMIKDAETGKLDYLLAKSISRFSRNVLDTLTVVRQLKTLGVGVYFQKENIDTLDSKNEVFLSLISIISQEESRNISTNMKWSLQKRYQRGKPMMPTKYFLGYTNDEDGNVIIDEAQAKTVRRIYKEYLDGYSTPSIAKNLMRDGVKTARNNENWYPITVYNILTNEKFTGNSLGPKTITVDFLTHKRVKNTGQEPMYLMKNTHPAIISESDFNEVQNILKRKKDSDLIGKAKRRHTVADGFADMGVCGDCGNKIVRRTLTSVKNGDKAHFYAWHCALAAQKIKSKDKCKASYIWEEDIKEAFNEVLFNLKNNKTKVISQVNEEIKLMDLLEEDKMRLKEIDKKIELIANRITELSLKAEASKNQIYNATIRNLVYEQEILRKEFEILDKNNEDVKFLKRNLETLLTILKHLNEEDEFSADHFERVIDNFIVFGENQIKFVFKCGISKIVLAKHKRK